MGKYFGIDLGTTYSCIATINNGVVEVLRNSDGDRTTPSVIGLRKNEVTDTIERIVGNAVKQNPDFEGVRVEEIKRYMADESYSIEYEDQQFSPTFLSSLILKKLKEDVEAQGYTIDGVTITCPAYFGQVERQNTKAAGIAAGLNVLSVINEPTAAAYSYVMSKLDVGQKKTVLVYDLGGGTFDVTLLEMEVVAKKDGSPQRIVRVIDSNGNATLGGKDWDRKLMDAIVEKACEKLSCATSDLTDDVMVYNDLTIKTELAKKGLSVSDLQEVDVMIPEDFTSNTEDSFVTVELSVEEFEELTAEYLDTTMTLTNNVLNELIAIRNQQAKNGQSMQKLDEILLVGGSTRMPQVSKALRSNEKLQALMDEVVITVHDPDEAVASGAALWAELMGTAEEEQFVRPNHSDPIADDAHHQPTIEQVNNSPANQTAERSQSPMPSWKESAKIPVVVEEKLHKSYGVVVRDDNGVTESLSNIIYKDTAYDPKVGISHVKSYKTIAHAQKQIRVRIIENIATANDPETIELNKATSQYEAKQIFDFDFDLPEGTPKGTPLFIQFFFDPSAILRISVAEQFKGTKMENQQVEIGGVVTDIAALKMRQRLEELTRND